MDSWRELVLGIAKEEGGYLHRNPAETDITTGYGIYRTAQPDAKIFNYIDSIAKSLGINTKSNLWSKQQLELIQSKMDKETELSYSIDFYKNYFKAIRLDEFPIEVSREIASIYTNGPKIACKALQRTVNQFIEYGVLSKRPWLTQDGILGAKSWESINELNSICKKDTLRANQFKYLFIGYCKTYYIELAVLYPDKYLRYLRGWNKRVDNLLDKPAFLVN